jgi:hypothetical protein
MSIDTQRLKALAEKATPGPWITDDNEPTDAFRYVLSAPKNDDYRVIVARISLDLRNAESTASMIAACDPQTVTELLAENERYRAALTKLRGTYHCPICDADIPHGHEPPEIHRWLEAQATRFGLTIRCLDEAAYRQRVEYLESDRGQFELWTETFPARPWPLHRDERDNYSSITTGILWDCWRTAWAAARAALKETET